MSYDQLTLAHAAVPYNTSDQGVEGSGSVQRVSDPIYFDGPRVTRWLPVASGSGTSWDFRFYLGCAFTRLCLAALLDTSTGFWEAVGAAHS